MEALAKLITAGAWGLVALTLAAGIPFAWRKVLAYIEPRRNCHWLRPYAVCWTSSPLSVRTA